MIGQEGENHMASGYSSIITQLEQQKAAIERALTALHSLDGNSPEQAPHASTPAQNRRSEGQRKRWAAKKAVAAAPATPAPRKVRFSPEGRKRLAEAMRRRWAAKRTAAQAKRKKAAA
jgi:uncharacterized membrane protein